MFGAKSTKPQNRIDSLIGAGTRIEGNVIFSGGLRIDGEVKGDVTAAAGQPSTVVVSEQARVEGAVRVTHMVVNGTIEGPVHVSEFLELQPKSRVMGDIHYKSLEIHLGAVVEGRLVHGEAAGEGKAVELKLAKGN
ncbi:MAG: polymer-forming cytoskeletal protein [Burkholderiales bacterium]|nr:polymer-forming cytoskeletal protein [Burkholderiales bacterium]